MEIINAGIAQQIVDTVKDVCQQNINFIDASGINVVNLRAFYAMCNAYITHCKGSKNPC